MREGWKCPVCGQGVSPNKDTCDHNGSVAPVYQPVYIPMEPTTPVWPSNPWDPWWVRPTTGTPPIHQITTTAGDASSAN